ncbi:MAG: hypothetical protein FWG91_10155 [Lachnospiraceae bacterium]|nr:hypothetical protein [Lachnospiraceae bacterium]
MKRKEITLTSRDYAKLRARAYGNRPKKKRLETSKILVVIVLLWAMGMVTICIIQDKQQDIATTLIVSIIAVILSYLISARFGKYHEEKNKRAEEREEFGNEDITERD